MAVIVIGGFAALRLAQMSSISLSPWDHEWHLLGTLALDLDAGHAKLGSLREFVQAYRYEHTSSLITQVLTAALSQVFGVHALTQRATSLLAELLCVGLLSQVLLRRAPGWAVLPALLPWLLPIPWAVDWLLSPYGNHTEFLWVGPAGLALGLGLPLEGERLRRCWPAGLAAALLVKLYPPLLAVVIAIGAAWLVRRAQAGMPWRRVAGLAMAGVAAAAAIAVSVVPHALPNTDSLERLAQPEGWPALWSHMLPQVGAPLPALHIAALLAAAVAAVRRESRAPALFALAWFVGAFAAATFVRNPADRYFLPALFACLLCATVAATAPRGWWRVPGLVVCLLLAQANLHHARLSVRPELFASAADRDSLGLDARLGVLCAAPDELPWLADMLRGHRGSAWVGGLPGPPERGVYCGHLGPRQFELLDRLRSGHWAPPEGDADEALRAMGAGLWISHGRSIPTLQDRLGEWALPDSVRERLLEGARAEAAATSLGR